MRSLLALAVLALPAHPQELAPGVELVSAHTLDGARDAKRAAVYRDVLEAAWSRGELAWTDRGAELPPAPFAALDPEGDPPSWSRFELTPDEDGRLGGGAIPGEYAWLRVESDADRVVLLDARGHRWVHVGETPRVGDLYGTGWTRVPVALREGTNHLLFRAGRGGFRVRLQAPESPVLFQERDTTKPDLVRGEGGPAWFGLVVLHAADRWRDGVQVEATLRVGERPVSSTVSELPALAPLGLRKLPIALEVPEGFDAEGARAEFRLWSGGTLLDSIEIDLRVVDADAHHTRTFHSAIDSSAQEFGVRPAQPEEGGEEPAALFLSFHGASVQARRQAGSYAPKTWGHVVAPTNRRPFGFDWEDWGRLDALEVLDQGRALYDPDPRRVYLTGHSMGGHGTWNFGAHFPDLFAAIAPSAGWRDFWSYGGALEVPVDRHPVDELLMRATNGSRTLLLERNYLHGGVYVLHGDADDNVPVTQARFMRERLASFHPNFAYYEQPGAGHWWGNRCVDWPPLFDFFERNVAPARTEVRAIEFRTVHPAISARCHWLTVEAQERWMAPSLVDVRLDDEARRIEGASENVARLAFDLNGVLEAGAELSLVLDGDEVAVAWPADGVVRARRSAGSWTVAEGADPGLKGPHRAGPFKHAFRNDALLVYGTRGDAEEDAWAFAKARFDAETFWYRGNGDFEIRADVDFDPAAEPDRNVVLYGSADTNAAWGALLGTGPVAVHRGRVTVGDRTVLGDDLACLFVQPRPGSDTALVGAVSGSGIAALRATTHLPYFVSGTGYPDWLVFSPRQLEEAELGVLGAGFFGADWSVGGGELAWR